MEEGKGQGGLATSHQYGNALLGVCYQEEEVSDLLLNLINFPYLKKRYQEKRPLEVRESSSYILLHATEYVAKCEW